jgi:hypothetical protein
MKTILMALLFVQTAYALPILNKNAAGIGSNIIIWPDHADPNHFYFAPSTIALSESRGEKAFSFIEYKTGCNRFGRKCSSKAMLSSLLKACFLQEDLEAAQNEIRKTKPQARFAVVPMLNGKVEFSQSLIPFIDNHSCSPFTAQASDEIPCSLTLNDKGIRTLKPILLEGKVLPMKFNYEILGVHEIDGKKYLDAKLDLGLAVQIGGELTINHPDLI